MPTNEYGQPVGEPVEWSPRPAVAPVTLTGRTVRLEPLTAAHAPALWTALVEGSPPSIWTYLGWEQPPDPDVLTEMISTPPPGWVAFAVILEGTAAGFLHLLRCDPAQGSVEVGGICLGAGLQRTAASTEAQYLLARHVFDDLGYRRYEWKCDSLNEPSRQAAARLGFAYEGRFRQALVYKGRNRDTDWFALTDADWPGVRAEYERWLDPGNFGADGRQLSRLTMPTSRANRPISETPGTLR